VLYGVVLICFMGREKPAFTFLTAEEDKKKLKKKI
jgi:hypothetical protein